MNKTPRKINTEEATEIARAIGMLYSYALFDLY